MPNTRYRSLSGREKVMIKQAGFALVQVMVLSVIVMGIVYGLMMAQRADSIQTKADKIALQATPATFAFLDYASSQNDGVYNGNQFYDDEYLVVNNSSADYGNTLAKIGFDYGSSDIKVTVVTS